MRITIEKGFQPLIKQVMQDIGVDDPRLALNHILGLYAASQKGHSPPASPHSPESPETPDEDDFTVLTDWS